MKRFISCILLSLFFSALVHGATIHVPADYSTIQEAIDAAIDDDTVLVAPGTYVENIDFRGKAIRVKSTGGARVTVIDGGSPVDPDKGSVVAFQNDETRYSVLDGFSLIKGTGTVFWTGGNHFGGGVFSDQASPNIKNNIIDGNTVNGYGGGIYCAGYSEPSISNNVIMNNSAIRGGGIYCTGASPIIGNNIITCNTAEGLYGSGGGIFGYFCSSIITNNIISKNSAVDLGGGVYLLAYCYPTLENNTIVGNAAMEGGGFCSEGFSSATVENTIFWNNTALTGPQIQVGSDSFISTLTIAYSDVEGGQSSVHVGPGSTLVWEAGMIDEDPLFVTGSHGLYYLSQTAAAQTVDSPCVDAGSDTAGHLKMDTCWTRTDEIPDAGMVDMGFHFGPFSSTWTVPFYTQTYTLSESTGGTADLPMNAGAENGSRQYMVFGSITGTTPGTVLPGEFVTLPLNWDLFTMAVIGWANTPMFTDFMGTLDGSGMGAAQLNLPPAPGTTGLKLYFAYALNNKWDFVSNPVAIEIIP